MHFDCSGQFISEKSVKETVGEWVMPIVKRILTSKEPLVQQTFNLIYRQAEPYEDQFSRLGIHFSPAIPFESKKEELQRIKRNRRRLKYALQSEDDSQNLGDKAPSQR